MSDPKKYDEIEQFKRSTRSKPKDLKQKLHTIRKQVFLTDTQTSDYTKSSGQMRIYKIQQLELTVRDLERENQQLKQTIINMKANQFFQLNQEKLKDLIKENQRLKHEYGQLKNELEQSLIERDFLKRFNKNLKNECELLTKKILNIKNSASTLQESRKIQKPSLNNSSSEDLKKNQKRSISNQVGLGKRRIRQKEYVLNNQRKEKQVFTLNQIQSKTAGRGIEPSLNFEYFHGSFNEKKNKYNN